MMPIMKDFTRQARVVEFQLDDDTFRGKPHLPAQTMIDFTLKVGEMEDEKSATPQQGFDTMMECLEMVLMPDSYKLFRSRMKDPEAEVSADAASAPGFVPIELEQVTEILDWVMGEYGLRPTKPSEDSSAGPSSPESGTNSTDSTSDVVSISAISPSTDSSTSSTTS
jgi:hypothetical protein